MAKNDTRELIFGLHAVSSALTHRPEAVLELWYDTHRKDRTLSALVAQARTAGVALHGVGRAELEQRAPEGRHQGVVARVRPARWGSEHELAALVEGLDHPALLLVLDGVQDPHNLGACLRTADAAGVDAVVVPKDRAVGLTPVVRKVASGAAETLPVFQVTNLVRTLKALQRSGIWIIGLADQAAASLYEHELTGALALVLGAEGKGLRRLTREQCDWLARIPMQGSVESLNVSVAVGVCLYEAVRQRRIAP